VKRAVSREQLAYTGGTRDSHRAIKRCRRIRRIQSHLEIDMEDILQLFDTLLVEFIPRSRPDSGTRYVYSWTEESKKGMLYLYNLFKSFYYSVSLCLNFILSVLVTNKRT